VATGYAKLAGAIKELAHGWLLGKKRKGTGSDRSDAKRIRLDSGSSASRGKGGGGKCGESAAGKGAGGKGGKRGKGSRNGDGKGPASGRKKGFSGE
jgi:hypothetical protein